MAAAIDVVGGIDNSNSGSFNYAHNLGGSANVIYVFVAGAGYNGHASFPVTGVTVGGNAMTRVFTDTPSGKLTGIDVYVLVNPPTGSQSIVFTRLTNGYAPVSCVSVSITGGDTTTPDDGWTKTDASSPNSSPYTRTAAIASQSDSVTLSALSAVTTFSTAATTVGFQTQIASRTDADSRETRVGQAAGTGASVTHSYDLQADAGARLAMIVSANIRAAGGGGGPTDPTYWRTLGFRTVFA